jgi:hypothetical protein
MAMYSYSGNYGNMLDGQNNSVKARAEASENEEQAALINEEGTEQQPEQEWHSTTDPMVPQTEDR